MRPLTPPALLPWRVAGRARWTRLYFQAPAAPRLGPPGVQGVLVILLLRHTGDETRHVVGRDGTAQGRCRATRIEPGTGNKDGPS